MAAWRSAPRSSRCSKSPGLDRTLDPIAVEDFFTYGYIPDPKTIYAAIRKLPAAHALIVRRGRPVELMQYWNLLDNLHARVAPENPKAGMVDALRHAVKLRLISDVEVGALLSGGVDSSAVVALMAGLQEAPVSTFSIGFQERDYDESAYAKAVSDRYGTSHHTRIVDPGDFSLLPRLPGIYDEPFGDISALPTFAVCKLARQTVKAALTGDGGDEILGGYRRYAFFAAQMRARSWIARRRARPVILASGRYLSARRAPAAHVARQDHVPRIVAQSRRCLSAHGVGAAGRNRARNFSPAISARAWAAMIPAMWCAQHFNVDAPLDMLQRAQYTDIMTYLPGDILTKVDRASMANSLELRSPFLDQELSDWSFSLPDDLKLQRGAGGKAILKKAMEDFLPRDLLYRSKKGFTVPVAEWFRGPLREDIRALAQGARLKQSGFFDTDAIAAMADAHIAGSRDFSKPLWLLWVFGSFLDHAAQAN